MSQVTQAEIARVAGVSKMTVSRALRGGLLVRPELAARIRRAAAELGYVPDPEVARLMTHLRRARKSAARETLAFVWTEPPAERPANPWGRQLFEGAAARAAELGYALEAFQLTPGEMTAGRLARILQHRGVRGLMLSPLISRSRGHLRMPWEEFSVVVIGLGFLKPAFHRVHHHHFLGVMTALRRLRKAGYQRIGLCVPAVLDRRMFGAWSAGFLVHHPPGARVAAGLMHLPQTLNRAAFAAWCEKAKPEVVLESGQAARSWLAAIPARARPAHATLSWHAGQPEVAGLDQRSGLIGATAADLLIEQLRHNERGVPAHPKTVMVEGVWREAQSSA